jgi:hypothetical protein
MYYVGLVFEVLGILASIGSLRAVSLGVDALIGSLLSGAIMFLGGYYLVRNATGKQCVRCSQMPKHERRDASIVGLSSSARCSQYPWSPRYWHLAAISF